MDRESFAQLMDAGEFGNSVHSVPVWDKPIPFGVSNTPDFPVDALPAPVAAFVEELAESTQTPTEMSGILSLGILSTAFQSRFEVEITPDWREPLCLYPVAVAPPGERKSAVISSLTAPVYEYEAEQRELEAAEIAQNQTERVLLEKALQAAQNSAAKGKGDFEVKRKEALSERLWRLENRPENMIPRFVAEFEDGHRETYWGAEVLRCGKESGVKCVQFDEQNQNGVDIAALYALLHDGIEISPQ